jgi:hypothetical protein
MLKKFPLLIVPALFLSSCTSNSDNGPQLGPTDNVSPSSSTLPDAPHSAEDQRKAEAAVLKPSDVGKGFKTAPQAADPRADEDDATLSACLQRPPTRTRESAKALSLLFTKGDARRIRAGASYVVDEKSASADLAALRSDAAAKCLEDLMRADTERQGSKVEVRVERISPPPVENSAAFSLIVIVTAANGQKLPSITDYVAAVKGRGEVDAYFQDVNGHVEKETMARLMRAMIARL